MIFFTQAIHEATPYLEHYGYFAIFAAIFMEGVGIPAPGVTMLVAGALVAGRGEMSLPLVLGTALGAAILGFNSGYWLGAISGQAILRHLPFVNRAHVEKLHRLFLRWGVLLVLAAPFIDGLRQVNGYAAGIGAMSWPQFALTNLLGVCAWVGVWGGLAYEAGTHAVTLYCLLRVGDPRWYLGAGLAVLFVLAYLFWNRRRRETK